MSKKLCIYMQVWSISKYKFKIFNSVLDFGHLQFLLEAFDMMVHYFICWISCLCWEIINDECFPKVVICGPFLSSFIQSHDFLFFYFFLFFTHTWFLLVKAIWASYACLHCIIFLLFFTQYNSFVDWNTTNIFTKLLYINILFKINFTHLTKIIFHLSRWKCFVSYLRCSCKCLISFFGIKNKKLTRQKLWTILFFHTLQLLINYAY